MEERKDPIHFQVETFILTLETSANFDALKQRVRKWIDGWMDDGERGREGKMGLLRNQGSMRAKTISEREGIKKRTLLTSSMDDGFEIQIRSPARLQKSIYHGGSKMEITFCPLLASIDVLQGNSPRIWVLSSTARHLKFRSFDFSFLDG